MVHGFLTACTNIHSKPRTGKHGTVFSGECASSAARCFLNHGQLFLSELEWLDEAPHETQ